MRSISTALATTSTRVFNATSDWLDGLGSLVLDTVPDTARRLPELAGIPESMDWLVTMWSDRPVWWFVQWPVIGHGHAHVGQAWRRARRTRLQPVRRDEGPEHVSDGCESCGGEEPEVWAVHRVYVTPADWDTEGREDVQADVERWCYACLASYPHEMLPER